LPIRYLDFNMTREQDCLHQMRDIYAQFDGNEIAQAIKIIRSELTAEELRTELQKEILEKQKKLDELR